MKDIAVLVAMVVVTIVLCGISTILGGTLTYVFVQSFHPSVSFLSCLKLGFLETISLVGLRMAYIAYKN